ncbi:hypothetical protein Tco_0655815 [Tanacetum coccineum]|uniref:Retrovirus-related Pol polyprotein from transposon TNT 1-94 n=1 Tax=Tanacetum coccineum TaxID=301880 RepID=A0ABQ4X711_9ASTR
MVANQAIEYAPQCGDLTAESLTFGGTTNLVNNRATSSGSSFMNVDNSSSGTTPIIDKIGKFKELLTSRQAILVDKAGNPLNNVEFSGEYDSEYEVALIDNDMARSIASERFWCTAIAYDLNRPINDSEARPLKEYLIKFSVMNGKKSLILDYNTFVESTRLDYAKGTYVSHPSTEVVKESDNKEVFAAREEMDEDFPPTNEEVQSPPPHTDKPKSSHAQESDYESSSHALKKYDNILPLTERQLNVDHGDQTDKLVQEDVKEDSALNKKVLEATEAYTTNSNKITELLSLAKTFDFSGIKSLVETMKVSLDAQNDHLETWDKSSTSMALNVGPRLTKIEHTQALMQADLSSLKSYTLEIKLMMTKIYQAFKAEEEPTRVVPISTVRPITRPNLKVALIESSSRPLLTGPIFEIPVPQQTALVTQREGKGIATDEQLESTKKLVPASKVVREYPDEPIKVPYMINGKMHYLTNDEINAHLEKEDKIKKAVEEAKMFEMTKTEVIKVVQEEAEKIGLDPKTIVSEKKGEKFKKAQDTKHQFLKREHSQRVKRLMELNKKRAEQYMLTIFNRLKQEPITNVRIHPNSKPAILTVFKNNVKRNFQVHNPFKFSNFRVIELDELGPIIQKKKKTIVKDLMVSLGKRYEILKKIPEELEIQSALPAPIPEQAPSQSSKRKWKHMDLELRSKCQGWSVIEVSLKVSPLWNDIHKVGVDSLVSYLVMASMIKTPKNARFGLKLKKLIAEHPDQEKL